LTFERGQSLFANQRLRRVTLSNTKPEVVLRRRSCHLKNQLNVTSLKRWWSDADEMWNADAEFYGDDGDKIQI